MEKTLLQKIQEELIANSQFKDDVCVHEIGHNKNPVSDADIAYMVLQLQMVSNQDVNLAPCKNASLENMRQCLRKSP